MAPPSAAASGDLQPAANEANLPPVAQSWPWLAVSGVPLHFNITATDPDRDVLSLELLDAPVHGVLSGCSPPECVYTPDAGFVGLDSIRWRVSDGPHRSDVGVSSFSVTAERFADPRVPDPWPSDGTVVFVDAAVVVHLVTDAEGNPDPPVMTPVIVVPPSHGELADCAQNGGAFRCRYTPEPGFVGRDAFKWQAAIGPYVSAIGTYTIDVIPYPPPSASSGVAVMVGDCTNELRLFHSYTPATVTFEIVSSPSHGLLAGCEWVATSSAVVCEYTPEPGFRGDDSLTWRWTDGEMWSDPGQITLRVIDDHRPDVTEPPPAITREAKPVKVSITATDRDGDVLTIDVVEPPLHGILTDCADLPWDGQYGCTYHPEPGFVGRDRFVWSVSDGQAAPVRRTAGIDVREDQPPVAAPATWTTRIGRTVFALLAVDDADDGNQLAATLVGRPLHGTVRETSGLYWQYTPDPGFAGTDSFTFRASDGLLETLPTAITVIVTDNDRPTAESQVVRLPRGRLASFHLAGADPDHDPLGYRYIEVPAHGVMGWGNNSEPGIGIEMLYLAEAGFTGWDHLTYIANDGVLDSEPATIWIGVGDVGAAGPPSPTPGPTASDDGTGGSGSPRLTLPPTDTDIVVGDPPESGIAPWVTTVLLVGALAVASLTRRRRAALRDPMRR